MLLHIQNLYKSYPQAQGKQQVLSDLSLQVNKGDTIAITGPSGCGKSTLLHIIGALDQPDSGKVLFDGQDLLAADDQWLSQYRNTQVGFVFQDHRLLPQCTVVENILLPTLAGKLSAKEKKAKMAEAHELIKMAGLTGHHDKYPAQLSGGECQRVAFLRAMINKPRLILADEPTGSVDEKTADQLIDFLVQLNKEFNVSIVLVTHAKKVAAAMQKELSLHNGVLQPAS